MNGMGNMKGIGNMRGIGNMKGMKFIRAVRTNNISFVKSLIGDIDTLLYPAILISVSQEPSNYEILKILLTRYESLIQTTSFEMNEENILLKYIEHNKWDISLKIIDLFKLYFLNITDDLIGNLIESYQSKLDPVFNVESDEIESKFREVYEFDNDPIYLYSFLERETISTDLYFKIKLELRKLYHLMPPEITIKVLDILDRHKPTNNLSLYFPFNLDLSDNPPFNPDYFELVIRRYTEQSLDVNELFLDATGPLLFIILNHNNPEIFFQILDILLFYGLNPNITSSLGNNLSMYEFIHHETLILLDLGIFDINQQNYLGNTLFHYFVRSISAHTKFLKKFIKYGADPFIKNKKGNTVLDDAKKYNFFGIQGMSMLEEYASTLKIQRATKKFLHRPGMGLESQISSEIQYKKYSEEGIDLRSNCQKIGLSRDNLIKLNTALLSPKHRQFFIRFIIYYGNRFNISELCGERIRVSNDPIRFINLDFRNCDFEIIRKVMREIFVRMNEGELCDFYLAQSKSLFP